MINYNVPLNHCGQNANLKGNILNDKKMEANEFYYNIHLDRWRLWENLGCDISLTIKIAGEYLFIDVLDESFAQPYDYQAILRRTPDHKFALDIHNQVQAIMKQLSDCGIIDGYIANDYI